MELIDTKPCPYCKEEIKVDAIKCRFCGEFLAQRQTEPLNRSVFVETKPERRWNPGVAAVWSFFIPGVGQIYKSQLILGLLWIAIIPSSFILGWSMVELTGKMGFALSWPICHLTCVLFAAYGGNPYTGETSDIEKFVVFCIISLCIVFIISLKQNTF